MAAAEFLLSEGEDAAVLRTVLQGLNEHNAAAAGPHGYRAITLAVRRPGEEQAAGGLIGHAFFGWFFVKLLFLPQDLRGQGHGAALLRRAEDVARELGCTGIHLDTFSFQARPFYERLGYRVFGTIEDHPPGHRRHFMMKRLDGGDAAPAGPRRSDDVPA